MTFFGSVVVRISDRCVLSQATNTDGTFTIEPSLWADIVTKCTEPKYRTTYITSSGPNNKVGVHILTDEELGFAVISAIDVQRRHGHLFLDEVSKLFAKSFLEKPSSLNPRLCEPFNPKLKDFMNRCSDTKVLEDTKVKKVRSAVDEVKDIALDNVEKVLQRGTQIDSIIDKTDELQTAATGFQRQSKSLKMRMWWQSMRGTIALVALVFVFLLALYLIFCGGFSCSSSKPGQTEKPTMAPPPAPTATAPTAL